MDKGYIIYDRNFKTLWRSSSKKLCFCTEHSAIRSWNSSGMNNKAYIDNKYITLKFTEQTRYIVVCISDLISLCLAEGLKVGGVYEL